MKKRIVSILTALTLCLGLLPGTAWAVDGDALEDKSGGWVYPYVALVPKETATYTAGSGTITWEPQLSGDTVVSGTLTLNNATINAETKGIQIPVPATVVLEGTNNITIANSSSDAVDHVGIVVDRYDYEGEPPHEDLTLKGPGSLTINSSQFGIIADGGLTIDGANVSVTTQSDRNCITARNGDVIISDSTVYAKEGGGLSNYSGGLCSSTGNLSITDSKVTTISTNGYAINAYMGKVSFTNSDVVAIGNVPLDRGEAPIKFFQLDSGIHFQISGGTLFAQNNASGGRDVIYKPALVTATDSAVIYYHGATYYLIQNGDNIQYANCTYDETTGEITVGNGYVMGSVEWNDNILFGAATSNLALRGRNWVNGAWQNGNITIPAGTEAVIPANGYVFSYGNFINNGALTINGYFDNYGTLTNNGTINNYLNFYNEVNAKLIGNGTVNNFYLIENVPSAQISDNMVINGLVRNSDTSVSPGKFEYVAHGDAQTGYPKTQLILGKTPTAFQPLYILPGSIFTISEGYTVLACFSEYDVTWDTLETYLSVEGEIIVNGTLCLPPNPTQEQIDSLHLSGSGKIIFGYQNSDEYYPVNITGGTADKTLAKAGDTITLTVDPVSGKQFYGWTVTPNVTITSNDDGTYSFTMPSEAVTLTPQYTYTVTFNSQGGSDVGPLAVVGGQTATKPSDPTRENCTFLGWYTDAAGTTAFDFSTAITDNLTLYAKWQVPVEGVSLGKDTLSLTTGGTETLTVTLSPDDASDTTVTWASDNTDVVTVDESGKVTAVGVGTATITVTTTDGSLSATCTVTVTAPSSSGGSGGSSTPVVPPVSTDTDTSGGTTITETTAKPTATTEGDTASVTINSATAAEIVKQATENKSETVVIAPEVTGDVTKTEVSIPAATVGEIGSKTEASITVSTPVADMTIPNGGLGSLASGGGTVTVTAEKKGNEVTLSITAGGNTVSNIPGGITLTVPHDDCSPGTVAVLVHADGTQEVVRKSVADGGELKVTIPLDGSAKLEIVDNGKTFTDVPRDNWAADAVAFVSGHELFNGVDEGVFSPNTNMTRGMLAMVVHNLENNPSQPIHDIFADVGTNSWYAEAVTWAAEQGIVTGYGNGQFGPEDNITREQLAALLWRYAGKPVSSYELTFTDADQVSPYALDALRWAAEQGIVHGKGGGILDPGGFATRAEAAQMLMNFVTNMG